MQIQQKLIADTLQGYFSPLHFNEEKHTYTVDDGKTYLPSVSALIKKHVPYVNFEELAQKVANKKGVTLEEVQAEWKEKGKAAAEKGTKVHKYAEDYPEVGLPETNLEKQVVRFYEELPTHLVVVCKELRMYHKKYNYAGTSDLILLNTKTNKLIIADFKTNEDLFKYPYSNLLEPFHFLPTNDANKYQIQLNYYQILLEQTGYEVEDRVIIWLKENEYKIIYCNNYIEDLKKCLNKN